MLGRDRFVSSVALVRPRSAQRSLLPARSQTKSAPAPVSPARGSAERSSAANYLLPVRRGSHPESPQADKLMNECRRRIVLPRDASRLSARCALPRKTTLCCAARRARPCVALLQATRRDCPDWHDAPRGRLCFMRRDFDKPGDVQRPTIPAAEFPPTANPRRPPARCRAKLRGRVFRTRQVPWREDFNRRSFLAPLFDACEQDRLLSKANRAFAQSGRTSVACEQNCCSCAAKVSAVEELRDIIRHERVHVAMKRS